MADNYEEKMGFVIDTDAITPDQLLKVMKDIQGLPEVYQNQVRKRLRNLFLSASLTAESFGWKVEQEVGKVRKQAKKDGVELRSEEEIREKERKKKERDMARKAAEKYVDGQAEDRGTDDDDSEGEAPPSGSDEDEPRQRKRNTEERDGGRKKHKKDKRDKHREKGDRSERKKKSEGKRGREREGVATPPAMNEDDVMALLQ